LSSWASLAWVLLTAYFVAARLVRRVAPQTKWNEEFFVNIKIFRYAQDD